MTAAGDLVRTLGPTAFVHDDTGIANITHSSYAPGTPEVGVFFIAPLSGVIRITIGGGFRDNSSGDRVFLAPAIFRDNSSGEAILAPSVTFRGYLSLANDTEFQYGSRVSLYEGLTPGQLYYVRTEHLATPGNDPDTADIASRDIIVIPMP